MLHTLRNKAPAFFDKVGVWATYSLSGILAKKIVATARLLFLTAVNVPVLVIILYSLNNGLPVFDVYDNLSDKIIAFTEASVILTFLIALFAMGPGIVWFFADPALKNLSWVEKDRVGAIHRWTVRRWCSAFLPGLALVISLICAFQYQSPRTTHMERGASILGSCLGALCSLLLPLVVVLFGYFFDKRRKSVVSNPSYKTWLPRFETNVFAVFYSLICALVLAKAAEADPVANFFKSIKSYVGEFWFSFASFVYLTLGCIIILFFGSVWAGRRSYVYMLVFLAAYFFIFVSVWPGASTLLQNYMKSARLGGNAPIMMTVSKSVAVNWPELFEDVKHEEDVFRSKKLSLVILGKNKIFVRLPDMQKGNKVAGPIMMERSAVHEIMFLDLQSSN